jgi:hypothetical protein
MIEYENDASHYQLESGPSNESHEHLIAIEEHTSRLKESEWIEFGMALPICTGCRGQEI